MTADNEGKRRLGRGLDALLGGFGGGPKRDAEPVPVAQPVPPPPEDLRDWLSLSVKQISRNPFQPRTEFDEAALNELAESIKVHGVLQPILVRKVDSGYQLIAG